jgi:hypothetical protein
MSEKKYQLMVDPSPAGWAYGFPRALPEEAVGGTGYDLWVRIDFNLTEWVCSYGYPEESFEIVRFYSKEIEDSSCTTEQVRVESGERGVDYYEPGSDPQV